MNTHVTRQAARLGPESTTRTVSRLEEAGLLCRTYAGDSDTLVAAIRVIWLHLCELDDPYLSQWSQTTVAELVDLAMGIDGNRRFSRFPGTCPCEDHTD